MIRAWIYGRTSGDEADTGQDVAAQVEAVTEGARVRELEPVGSSVDDGVSGSVDPTDVQARPGFASAVEAVLNDRADVIVIAEASRFSRQHPTLAMLAWDQVRAAGVPVLSLAESHFDGREDEEDEAQVLLRFVTFWTSWKERRTTIRRTGVAMREIKAGRRKTKSGRAPGRERKVDEEKARLAASWMKPTDKGGDGLSLRQAAHRLSEQAGAFKTTDAKLRRRRSVSHQALGDALRHFGLVGNPNRSEMDDDQGGPMAVVVGPLDDQGVKGS